MTPPTPPPAPPSADNLLAPTVAAVPVKSGGPLESRFPRLYYDFETVAEDGKTKDVFVPKKTPPTLVDVVRAVCQAHGTSDPVLIADLKVSITEFLDE